MLKKNLELIKDNETRLAVEFLQENAIGKAIELSAVPTAAAPLLKDNEIGYYSNIVYFRIENKIYVITPSSVITIT